MSKDLIIPLILLILYGIVGLVAMVSVFIELYIHKASWNSIKIFFYSLLILQCMCRCIILGWGMIETVQGGEFYSNFPSLLFISYCGLIALQMIQFLPDDNQYLLDYSKKNHSRRVKISTNILIMFNLFMYFGMFLLFGIAEKQIGNSTSFNHHKHNSTTDSSDTYKLDFNNTSFSFLSADDTSTSTSSISSSSNKMYIFGDKDPIYIVLDCFYFGCLLILFSFHLYVGWRTYKRNKDLFGLKLNLVHLILIICIFIRSVLVVVDPSSPENSILHIETNSWIIWTYTMGYYIVGEIIPGILLIIIEFLLPYHKKKEYINIGGELSSYQDVWKQENIAIHELLGMGGSGAMVHRCTVKKGPLRGGTFAVKVMKDCTQEDQDSLENEILVYENLKSPYIVSYQGSSKLSTKSGHIYEIRLFMEFIPHTLDKYLLARSVCGDKIDYNSSNGNGNGGSNYLLKNYFLHMQEYSSIPQSSSSNNSSNNNNSESNKKYPYYFTYSQIVWYLYQISIGLDTLHNNRIAHRDLKTNNIFVTLSDSQIKNCKIGDFDISKSFNNKYYKLKQQQDQLSTIIIQNNNNNNNNNNNISTLSTTSNSLDPTTISSSTTTLQNNKYNTFGSSTSTTSPLSNNTSYLSIQTAFQQDILAFGIIILDFLTLNNYSCLNNRSIITSTEGNQFLKIPESLPDYINRDLNLWSPIINLYKSCTANEPNMRPSSIEVKYVLSDLYKKIIENGTSDDLIWLAKDLSRH